MKHPLGTLFYAIAMILLAASVCCLIYYEGYTFYLAWKYWRIWGILACVILPGISNFALAAYTIYDTGTFFNYYTILSLVCFTSFIAAATLAAIAHSFKKKEG
jgi:hypothetical protein